MEFPLISIIIPVYNRKTFIVDALTSALAQTWPCLEIIVVDDGSDDGTWEVLETFEPDIIRVRQPRNMGQSAARNRGITLCRGDYILFLDSDDALLPDALENLWTALWPLECRNPAWGFSYGKRLTCNERLEPVKVRHRKRYCSGEVLPRMLSDHFIHTGTYLVRKSYVESVGGFKEDLAAKEDLLFNLSLAARCRFIFTDRPIVRYRRHNGVRARNDARVIDQGTRHLDYFFDEHPSLRSDEIRKARKTAYADTHKHLGKLAWRARQPVRYLRHWRGMCAFRPAYRVHPKYLFRALVSAGYVRLGRE
ncbi:glycosyl transferase [Desulfonema ishimotonii]|uniref:Glycosyl transferase n=1 Tax=Desulfonema ishimotonii TaxID=45657 RepID=A0A401FXE7_9BACT|nr:glycosyltransferase [Desulfonema ishimotonii]GBC61635.1 glycosyl transferase [Desulfonema ishimotonii]